MDGTALNGKIALITGGTSGIGEAIARGMSAAGAKVAFCGRRREEGENIAKSLSGDGAETFFEQCDVSDGAQLEKFVANTTKRFGKLDIAVNCAGISCPIRNWPKSRKRISTR